MSVADDVSNDERSKPVSDEQPLNILSMSVTFDVLNDERSRPVSDVQLLNM